MKLAIITGLDVFNLIIKNKASINFNKSWDISNIHLFIILY